MTIRPLSWRRTSLRNITVNGKPMATETWEARNLFSSYKVYRAISGNYFVVLPEDRPDTLGLPAVHYGQPGTMNTPKTPCASIEEGKRMAEAHWRERAATIVI